MMVIPGEMIQLDLHMRPEAIAKAARTYDEPERIAREIIEAAARMAADRAADAVVRGMQSGEL